MAVSKVTFYKKGFTLVELAIVLVIIGLLIGGILAAQSMIATAKIVRVSAQIQQFDVGVENFKTKYNFLPGDALSFGGDGDGLITDMDVFGTPQLLQINTCEISHFWGDVFPDKYAQGATCGFPGERANTDPSQGAVNFPESKLGSKGSFFLASAIASAASPASYLADTTNPRNYYVLLGGTNLHLPDTAWAGHIHQTDATNSATTPIEAAALDAKIDDGKANSGNVMSGSINGYSPSDFPLTGLCSNLQKYILTDTANECTPIIRIGASAGDAQ